MILIQLRICLLHDKCSPLLLFFSVSSLQVGNFQVFLKRKRVSRVLGTVVNSVPLHLVALRSPFNDC